MCLDSPRMVRTIVQFLDHRHKAIVVELVTRIISMLQGFWWHEKSWNSFVKLESDIRENHVTLLVNYYLTVLAL